MGRPGRHRKWNAKRRSTTRAGRAEEQLAPGEKPQREYIVSHRLRIHGMREIGTEHPLDVLAAKGLLTTPEERKDHGLDIPAINSVRADAGHKLASLHGRIHGPNAARAQDVNRAAKTSGSAAPTERDEKSQAAYLNARSTLYGLGRPVMDAVFNCAVYKRTIRIDDEKALTLLRLGLAALAGEDETAAAKRPMRAARELVA